MRLYDSTSYRATRDGIEVEAPWTRVRWLAIGLLLLLPLVARSPLGLGLISLGAVAVFLFPPRRRVVFDGARKTLRIEHAGFFREAWRREIPFADLRRLVLQRNGRAGGRPVFAAYARTGEGRLYLFTHAGEAETAALEREVQRLLEAGPMADQT